MFTGLVEEVGTLAAIGRREGGRLLRVSASLVTEDLVRGDSVAVNGVCQTVTDLGPSWFAVEAVGDTLEKTTLGKLEVGSSLNLERACRANSRLGGHFVLGHVNGVGRVDTWYLRGESWVLEVSTSPSLVRYLVAEGSIAIDGISLTIAEVVRDHVRVSVIPHTRASTTFQELRVGQPVNLEVDILAKYVEGLLRPQIAPLGPEKLKEWGYL